MGFWTIIEGFILLSNALAILNEDRFLAPRGWGFSDHLDPRTNTVKRKIIGLIYFCQYGRIPLIVINSITIIAKLVFG
ncbi:protein transport protein yos1-like [Lotus japonicus]|uniref:Yos1-like protein n=1 Tax=Lotus japonicus TaxID=34305 RepID=I3T6B4_LOTJA|nr:protein transport protein yos1-like [Lotus japonicus]XP_057441850.1 protein transport protein yos1-like [Lotus japonicus]AFK48056.1 unknown [Lotus japonicus]